MNEPCKVCGSEYTRTGPHHLYCSDPCRKVIKNRANAAYRNSEKGKAYFVAYKKRPEYLARLRERYKLKERTEEQKAAAKAYQAEYRERRRKANPEPQMTCRKCGITFRREQNASAYCGERCRNAVKKANQTAYEARIAQQRKADPALNAAHKRKRAERARK